MKNVDYIIVGDGYAALFFAHQLTKNKKSFVIFSEGRKSASQISAGIVNPVVLKKFTTFWRAQEQLDFLKISLAEIEKYTGVNYLIDASIHRIFHDENEQRLWSKKAQTEELSNFLNQNFKSVEGVRNDFNTGIVDQSARLNVNGFFGDLLTFHENNAQLIKEKFYYDELNIDESTYQNIKFSKIIFCEGMAVKNNPYFSDIPVIPNKGHHIRIRLSMPIHENITIKKKHFLFPLNDDLYFYGGTYDRDQLHEHVDESAVEQLRNGLSEFYPNDFDIEEVHFGFRPTVKDRRPIVGRHFEHHNLYVFNGLGARGILNGCYFSKSLYDFIESNVDLPEEICLDRF
ncbi:NAD(P)/FAD-dependent oxidoreductase [Chryseobacterium sp. JAH]|uniref:NAD(P)/FAD-dependent oxidoreductase n=1 Tax=Chryseobacterium sp. JAH TaxID=1742858 RepID=UPI00064616D3|nr:FAD-dependent oxidoreductase [Chryseobacterium sp. JAH]KUJ51204.1 FAD-dependent oxidoreductase [Chryseobacterium sp. JAH]